MKSLDELRFELAVEYHINSSAFATTEETEKAAFKAGFDAALKVQAELAKEVVTLAPNTNTLGCNTNLPAFDEAATMVKSQDLYKSEGVHDIHKATTLRWVFVDGCKWQHAQDTAALSAMKSEFSRAKEMYQNEVDKLLSENENMEGKLERTTKVYHTNLECLEKAEAEVKTLRAELAQETKEWNETVAQLNEASTEIALENTKIRAENEELKITVKHQMDGKHKSRMELEKLRADYEKQSEQFDALDVSHMEVVTTLKLEIDKLSAELKEQCQINGLGANKELKLINEIDKLNVELKNKSGAMPLELVDRSREILKQEYEAQLEKLRAEYKNIRAAWNVEVVENEHKQAAINTLEADRAMLIKALEALSKNENFCMGEYIGPTKEFTLMSDVGIACTALEKIKESDHE